MIGVDGLEKSKSTELSESMVLCIAVAGSVFVVNADLGTAMTTGGGGVAGGRGVVGGRGVRFAIVAATEPLGAFFVLVEAIAAGSTDGVRVLRFVVGLIAAGSTDGVRVLRFVIGLVAVPPCIGA